MDQKLGNLKMGCSGQWTDGLKPAVLLVVNFDQYPNDR